jgi:hypothetical protein
MREALAPENLVGFHGLPSDIFPFISPSRIATQERTYLGTIPLHTEIKM